MGKYDPLEQHLGQLAADEWRASFADIEKVLGFRLPKSARKWNAWWANDASKGHVHANAWLKAGWHTCDLNLTAERIVFCRERRKGISKRSALRIAAADKSTIGGKIKTSSISRPAAIQEASPLDARKFEDLARLRMGEHFGIALAPRTVPGVRKKFDLVSEDFQIIGDAKFFTLVRGVGLPPAKFSVIAEHVWLLEKAKAKHAFLVFGNDRRVPLSWLERYGDLVRGVDFYFLEETGHIDALNTV